MHHYPDDSTLGRTSSGATAPPILARAWSAVSGRPLTAPGQVAPAARATSARRAPWESLALTAILAVAAVLNLYGLANEGYANEYYAATVRSMMSSWHNFFFASFDPGGFVTVDKPPLGFMIQAISAKLFGYHGWSLLLPQALAGVASVALLYWLVRRLWGPLAGSVAALALAVSPISVVTNRNNTIDSLLALTSLAAVWAISRAVESGRHPLRWLLLGGLFVGLGFNIKMLEAYLVLPALWLAYLLAARVRPLARIGHLIVATVVTVAISLSWATIVDLTPASARPYVGSSQTNSVLELALGYNGLSRLLGRGGGNTTDLSLGSLFGDTSSGFGGGGGGVGGVSENGAKGILRLINSNLGGQIGWLVPLAVVGLLVLAWQVRPRRLRFWRQVVSTSGAGPLRRRRAALAIWGGWFVTMGAFFSIAGFYHRYYLTMLAPGIAALVGIGIAALWRTWARRGLAGLLGWALPAAIIGTAAVQVHILRDYPTWSARLTPAIWGLAIGAAVLLAATRLLRWRLGTRSAWASRPARLALALGLAALLLTPTVWSGISVRAASGGMAASLPVAGPAGAGGMGGFGGGMPGGGQGFAPGELPAGFTPGELPAGATGRGGERPATGQAPTTTGGEQPAAGTTTGQAQNRDGGGPGGQIDNQLLQWLIANRGDARYIVAVSSSQQADKIIIETGQPVMATGGFSGSDPILTADKLAQLVADGEIRYFILGGGMGGDRGGSGSVSAWVQAHGTLVSASAWGGTSSSVQLYDLATGK